MAKLKVFLEGTQIDEIELDRMREYLIGRGTTCDIILDHPKVSRQHLKLTFDGKLWNCRILSRFGNVQVNGHLVEDFSLSDGVNFTVPPYELRFAEAEAEKISDRTAGIEKAANESFDDKTQAGLIALKALLNRLENGKPVEEIKIGREKVTAGRSHSCEVSLKAPEASRRHFSIEFDGKNFVLTDLKSANKTLVNGKEVGTHTLESGDEISIGADLFRFELVHPDSENFGKMETVVSPTVTNRLPLVGPLSGPSSPAVIKMMPGHVAPGVNPGAHSPATQGGGGFKYAPVPFREGWNPKKDPKLKLKAALGLIGFVILYLVFSGDKKDDPRGSPSGNGNATFNSQDNRSFDRLSPEQKKFVEDTYNLSMNLYTSGKYSLAAIEIEKVIRLVSNYRDATNIRDLCQQALDIKKEQDERERTQHDQEDLKHRVAETLDHCEDLLKAKKYGEVEGCVSQINDLSPDNERGSNLVLAAKAAQSKIEAHVEAKANQARKKNIAYQIFNRAQKFYTERNYLPAIREFETVRKLAFADPEHLKEKAETGIKTAKAALMKQSSELVQEGKTALEQKDYGTALRKFSKALQIYPPNGDALEYKDQAARELHLEMKNLYSESVIEENLGNVESAKKKWHQILKVDEKSDSYYEKAQIKIRKYER